MSPPTPIHPSTSSRDRPSFALPDRSLVFCGVASSLAFLAADVAAGTLASRAGPCPGPSGDAARPYSFSYNSISELLVPSAPPLARTVGVAVMALSDVLGMAFGFGGVLRAAGGISTATTVDWQLRRGRGRHGTASLALRRRGGAECGGESPFQARLRVRLGAYRGGILMGLAATSNLISATVFPQDVRGKPPTRSGSMHLILVAASVLFTLPAMWILARTIPSIAFERFTVVTVSLMIAGALLTPLLESRDLLGVAERCSAYAYVVWQGVLSIELLYHT